MKLESRRKIILFVGGFSLLICFYTRNLNHLRNLKNDKSSNRETFPTFNFSLKNILSDEEILKVSSNG
jgi:hypothetical protein